MSKISIITILIAFIFFFGFFLIDQIPEAKLQAEVLDAIADTIDETENQIASPIIVDQEQIEELVKKSIQKLKDRQTRRLKFLISAYFVIWLIFMIYAWRIDRMQMEIKKRLDQLDLESQK